METRNPTILKLMAAVAVPKETEIPIPELKEFVKNIRLVPEEFCFKELIDKLLNKQEDIINEAINEGQLAVIYFYFLYNRALEFVAGYNYVSAIEFLVRNGIDIHDDDDYAMRTASWGGQLEAVEFLVKHGANVHARDNYALLYASVRGHLSVVKFLVEHGADIHADNNAALNQALRYGNTEIVEFLRSKLKTTDGS